MTSANAIARNNVHLTGNPQAVRTLVFMHGLGTDQTIWRDVTPAFEADWRIVLLDNAGAGGADPAAFSISRYLNLRPYAQDLLEVLEQLALHDVVVVGHSSSAMVGALAAIAAPERIGRLVMIGANPRYLNDVGYEGGMSPKDIDQIYQAATQNFPEWSAGFAAAAMGNPQRPELARQFAQSVRSVPLNQLLSVLCSTLQTDYRAELKRIPVPTLIMQSQHDLFVPMSVAEYLHAQIPNSRLRVIDATGHLPHVSAAPQVVAAIQEFLA